MSLVFLADRRLYADPKHFEQHFAWPFEAPAGVPRLYHCYWTGLLTEHHELSLKSLVTTQSPPFEVWVWMPAADRDRNREFIETFRGEPRLQWKVYDAVGEAEGTLLAGHEDLLLGTAEFPVKNMKGHPLTVPRSISDSFRLLMQVKYGGFYFDLDTLFLKDLRPLSVVDFIYQWSNQPCGSSALSYFQQGSPALQGLIRRAQTIGTGHPARLLTFSQLGPLPGPVFVLPSFAFDPVWIPHDTKAHANDYCNTFDDFFRVRVPMSLARFFPASYAYDWHNRWTVGIEAETLAGQLLAEVRRRFDAGCRG